MNINKTGKFLGAPGSADAFDDHVDPTITVSDRIGMTDSKRGIAQLESLKRDASDAGTMAGEGKRLNSGVGGPAQFFTRGRIKSPLLPRVRVAVNRVARSLGGLAVRHGVVPVHFAPD